MGLTYPAVTNSGLIGGTTGTTDNSILRADGTGGSTAQSTTTKGTLSDAGVLTLTGSTVGQTVIDPANYIIKHFDVGTDVEGTLAHASLATVARTWTFPDATGTVMLNPATTQGDIFYWNGTATVRLPKGTAGQVLTMNAGATAPEWV